MKSVPLIKHSHSEAETALIALECANMVRSAASNAMGKVLCLHGTLGMGKSVFARALIRALCEDESLDVPSPTFTLVQSYDAANGISLYHFDLYRLEDPEEIYELGWEDALSEGLCVVEWPERLGYLLPETCIDIHFETMADSPQSRLITLTGLEGL